MRALFHAVRIQGRIFRAARGPFDRPCRRRPVAPPGVWRSHFSPRPGIRKRYERERCCRHGKARLGRFPHYAWIGYWEHVRPPATIVTVSRRQVAFYVGYMGHGHAAVRWVRRGRERRFEIDTGTVRLSPADGDRHTLIGTYDAGNAFYTCMIPARELEEIAVSEDVAHPAEWHHMLLTGDPILRRCMAHLSCPIPSGEGARDGRQDESARRMVRRILQLNGGRETLWEWDVGVFDHRVIDDLVTYIDDHLGPGVQLSEYGVTGRPLAQPFREEIPAVDGAQFAPVPRDPAHPGFVPGAPEKRHASGSRGDRPGFLVAEPFHEAVQRIDRRVASEVPQAVQAGDGMRGRRETAAQGRAGAPV